MQPLIFSYNGKTPRVAASAFIAPGAVLIGDVTIGEHASVFYGAVLRADINSITVGERTNIQDNSVLHVEKDAPCVLGDDVTVGHKALVHGATIGNGTLIGMSATVLSRAVVGAGALVAAGAVILEGTEIPDKALAAGVPAKVRRELSDAESQALIPHAAHYVDVSAQHSDLGESLSLDEVRF